MILGVLALVAADVALGVVAVWWLYRALTGLGAQLAVLTLAVQDVRDQAEALTARKK